MRKITVLQLLPELNSGGVERGTLEISRALVEAGHVSIVVSAGGRMVKQLLAEGGEHITCVVGRKSPTTLARIRPLRRLLQERKPDILHLRSRLPAWVGYLAWRALPEDARPHLVTTVHGLYSLNSYSAIMTQGEAVIAVSETVRDYLHCNYPDLQPERIHLVHRGVDEEVFAPSSSSPSDFRRQLLKSWPQARARRLVTFPGRLTRWKGQLSLVRMLAELGGEPDLQVLVVGEVRRNKRAFVREVMRAAERAGVEDRLSLLGHRSDMSDIYSHSEMVLHLSEAPEAFGRVAAEALALGTPVLGWEQGGVGEILRRAFPAGAVPPNDFPQLIKRVRELISGSPPALERNAFPLREMQRKTLELYLQLVDA